MKLIQTVLWSLYLLIIKARNIKSNIVKKKNRSLQQTGNKVIYEPLVLVNRYDPESIFEFTSFEIMENKFGLNQTEDSFSDFEWSQAEFEIRVDESVMNAESYKVNFDGREKFFQLKFLQNVFNPEKKKIKKINLEIIISIPQSDKIFYYRNLTTEIYTINTTTIFGQGKIHIRIPRIINNFVWVINFLAIIRNLKLFLRSFKRTWLTVLLPAKYPRNFALYLSNYVNLDYEELNFNGNSCFRNKDLGCGRTKTNNYPVSRGAEQGFDYKAFIYFAGLIGSICFHKIKKKKKSCSWNLAILFFWVRVSLEFNNFTYYCLRIFLIGLHQNDQPSRLILPFFIISSLILGILVTNSFYERIGFHVYKIPFSKKVNFRSKLIDSDADVLKERKIKRKKKKGLKSILKITTVPSTKRELLTIELFKRLAFSLDTNNFKMVPFHFLNNLKSFFSTLIILLLGDYPILCCLMFTLLQSGMSIIWYKMNKNLICLSFQRKIIFEICTDLIFDSGVTLLTICDFLSYSYTYGIILQIFHFCTIVIKFLMFFLSVFEERKMWKARKKIIGGICQLEYHKKMGFGIIKYKLGNCEANYNEAEFEDDFGLDRKFKNLRDYDYEIAQFKVKGKMIRMSPLFLKKLEIDKEKEMKNVLTRLNMRILEEEEGDDDEEEEKGKGKNDDFESIGEDSWNDFKEEELPKPKIIINENLHRRKSKLFEKKRIMRLNKVKKMMMTSPEIVSQYGKLRTDKEKFKFIGQFI